MRRGNSEAFLSSGGMTTPNGSTLLKFSVMASATHGPLGPYAV
jgi:hypothetical protein